MKVKEYLNKYGKFSFVDEIREIKFNSDGISTISGMFKVKNFRKNNKSVV